MFIKFSYSCNENINFFLCDLCYIFNGKKIKCEKMKKMKKKNG